MVVFVSCNSCGRGQGQVELEATGCILIVSIGTGGREERMVEWKCLEQQRRSAHVARERWS